MAPRRAVRRPAGRLLAAAAERLTRRRRRQRGQLRPDVRSVPVSFDWAGIVEEEGTALGDAAALDLGAPVPAAPGWDVTELLRHIGLIHTRTSVILRTGTMERPSRRNGMLPEPPEDGVLDWYRATLAEVVADARAVDDPDRPVYAFAPGHRRAGFWPRRMAHETTVHRVDAEQAVRRPVGPIDRSLAVDGIDEVLSVFVPAFGAGRSPGDGARSTSTPPTPRASGWCTSTWLGSSPTPATARETPPSADRRTSSCCGRVVAGRSTRSRCSATAARPRPYARSPRSDHRLDVGR
jgi:uncharacterized protein (TIGR03083 family)